MLIVAGHITVEPEHRESCLAGCPGVSVGEYDIANVRALFGKGRA